MKIHQFSANIQLGYDQQMKRTLNPYTDICDLVMQEKSDIAVCYLCVTQRNILPKY
jgi:hypothetical protein